MGIHSVSFEFSFLDLSDYPDGIKMHSKKVVHQSVVSEGVSMGVRRSPSVSCLAGVAL